MTLDEAIRHAEEVAEKNEGEAEVYDLLAKNHNNQYKKLTASRFYTDCAECAADHRQLAEWLKELKDYRKTWDEIKKQIKEESNLAYADFDEYKHEVLGVDDIDELPDDDFRYGMERALEIINEYIRVVKE